MRLEFRDESKPPTRWGREEDREFLGRFNTHEAATAALEEATWVVETLEGAT